MHIPINLRVHRKRGDPLSNPAKHNTPIDLAKQMILEVADWLPDRNFHIVTDGFYAPLYGKNLPRFHMTSRIRSDAVIYELPPRRQPHRLGRPPKKGCLLPKPREMAQDKNKAWSLVTTNEHGKDRHRWVMYRWVIWWHVSKDPILLVISRDPDGIENDDYFFSTDLNMLPEQVVGGFAARWGVEDAFRNTKQFICAEDPQTWKGKGPERAATIGFYLYSMIWLWYIQYAHHAIPLRINPWYTSKATPSFQDALSALRRVLWLKRIIPNSENTAGLRKITDLLLDALERVA